MSNRFIALPVGQGDAFYLQRGNFHVLVDGGRSKRVLPGLLMNHARASHLDVVVCTHNDADHANGLIGLLEEQVVTIREVWLPGTWAWRFQDLVQHPYRFFDELAEDISGVGEEMESLEQYYEQYGERFRSNIETSETTSIPDHGADASEWLMDFFDKQDHFPWRLWPRHWPPFYPPHPKWGRLWLDCLDAAHRIKSIAKAAVDAGAKVRVFEFVPFYNIVTGGFQGQLEPVNSREVWPRKVPKKDVSALFYLALTKANRESLVFYAPEGERENTPGVLFTADSDLGSGLRHIQKPATNLVVTSPHHGSESNRLAYMTVAKWVSPDEVIWVRSDGRSKSRPGPSYKSQPRRICTLCNPPVTPKAVVRLHANRARWQRTHGTRWCSCK